MMQELATWRAEVEAELETARGELVTSTKAAALEGCLQPFGRSAKT